MSTRNTDRVFPYAVVDVFAEHALEGNMLAIFTDARGLTDDEMQALARETNLAETTFVFPSDDPSNEVANGVRVRIFTTQEELPFAGHPSLGTASWLYWNHPTLAGADEVTLRLNLGPFRIRFEHPVAGEAGVRATMRQRDPVFGSTFRAEEVSRVLGLAPKDFDPALPIQQVSTGIPFILVPIRSLEALGRLAIPQAIAQPWLDSVGAKFFHCITPAVPGSGADFRIRMQFYNGEDPATGAGAGCAIAYLVRHGLVPPGHPTVFEQGIEIRRPSRIHVRATLGGEATHSEAGVFVGGRTIPVASGHFSLPSRA